MAKSVPVSDQCPMEVGLNILSGKWTLRILWHISSAPIRFNELQRLLGIVTTKTLTARLRTLEKQRIVRRTVYPEMPPRVEYALTELGQSLRPILKELCEWGTQYHKKISRMQ